MCSSVEKNYFNDLSEQRLHFYNLNDYETQDLNGIQNNHPKFYGNISIQI